MSWPTGKKRSTEDKAKIGASLRGRTTGPLTSEHRTNISKAKKGIIPWNKGLKKEADRRVASPRLLFHLKNLHCKNIGSKRSEESKQKMGAWERPRALGIAIGNALRGKKFSEERKNKLRYIQQNRTWKTGPRTERGRLKIAEMRAKEIAEGKYSFWSPPTSLEFALDLLLQSADLSYQAQKQFGRYVVDAYVPEHNIVFEADGAYWHQDKKKEHLRDEYLINRGVLAVIHLTEQDLNSWGVR